MKRIFILIFTIVSIVSFAQSEIWGVKRFAGIKDGGVLFSIDSATNKINIEHRFQAPIFDEYMPSIKPVYDDELGIWFGVSGNSLFKYNPVNGSVESLLYKDKISGSFSQRIGDYYYILHTKGVLKLNINSFQYRIISANYEYNKSINENLIYVNRILYWIREIDGQVHICSLNIENESIQILGGSEVYSHAYLTQSPLIYKNDSLFGSYLNKTGEERTQYVFAYDITTDTIHIKADFKVDYSSYKRSKGLFLGSDQNFYSISSVHDSGSWEYIYKYDPLTTEITILAPFDVNVGYAVVGEIYGGDQEGFYMKCQYYGSSNKGCIIKYLIHENRFERVYTFKDGLNKPRFSSIEIYPNNVFQGVYELEGADRKRVLVNIDMVNDTINSIVEIPSFNEYLEGYSPGTIIQLDNGMIIGNTHSGGLNEVSIYGSYGDGVLYEFNPITKDYKLLFDFNIDFEGYNGLRTMIKLHNNHVLLGFGISFNDSACLFSFDAVSLQLDSIGTLPRAKKLYESDSTFVFWDSRIIERYHFLNKKRDTIFEIPSEFILTKVLRFTDQKMTIETKRMDSLGIRHTQIQNLDLKTQQLKPKTEIILTHEHEDGEALGFNYSMMADSNLVGVISEEVYDKENTTYLRFAKYYTNNDSIQVLKRGVHTQHDCNLDFNYTSIDDYNANGNVYALSFVEGFDYGRLTSFNFNKDTAILNDIMEPMTFDYEFDMDEDGHIVLKRFKKMGTQNSYWTGLNSSIWQDSLNWRSLKVPDANASIIIDGFKPHNPIIDTIVKCSQLLIKAEARLLIKENGSLSVLNNFSNEGNVSILSNDSLKGSLLFPNSLSQNGFEKYIYQSSQNIDEILASPLELNLFNKSEFYELYTYEADNNWRPVDSYPLMPQISDVYLYKSVNNVFDFVGQFNYGNQELDIPLQNHEAIYPLPNPYPSSINWNKVNLSNLSYKALYRFNASDSSFTSYLDGLGNASPLIQPLDEFWVYSQGDEQVLLDYSSQLHAIDFVEDVSLMKEKLVLQVSGASISDQTYIRFNEEASSDFDEEFDAFKFGGSKALQIFTFGGDETFSINQLPDTAMMDLSVKAIADGTYKISIPSHTGFDFVVLEDLIWNKRIDLLKEDYSFDYFTSDGNYPFKLYFKPWALQPVEEADIDIYYYPESLVIRSRKQIEYAEITFYDLAGRVVYKFHEENFFYIEKPISLPVGHYIVQLRSNNLVINRKVLVRK